MEKLAIKHQLLIILVLPLCCILFLGVTRLRESNKKIEQQETEVNTILNLSKVATGLGDLVHEAQKERGRTSTYLSNPTPEFLEKLKNQRKLTDEKLAHLQAVLKNFDVSIYSLEFQKELKNVLNELEKVKEVRLSVNNQEISPDDALQFYININRLSINSIEEMAKLTYNTETLKVILTYVSLLRAKENTGIERSVLSDVFAADSFSTQTFELFIQVTNKQKVYLETFQNYANDSIQSIYDELMKTQEVEEVSKIEQMAISKAQIGSFGMDIDEWFTTITVKCNQLKEVENLLAASIIQRANNLNDELESKKAFLYTTFAVVLLVILISVGLSVFVQRSIIKAFLNLQEVIQQVAKGNLTYKIEMKGNKETLNALANLKVMVDQLKSIISEISNVSLSLQSSSQKVNSNAQKISSSTTQQASSVEEITVTMEELTSKVQRNTENTKNVNEITIDVNKHVENTHVLMTQTKGAMENVVNKISIITEIARQTDLLALNAAVEAARAGKHGKGFAVVATEVRKLAENSRNSAEEIDTLSIETVSVTTDSQNRLESVLPQVSKVSQLLGEVTTASLEQATGINQIKSSLLHFNNSVQQNAGAAEEMSSNAIELKNYANNLLKSIQYFNI